MKGNILRDSIYMKVGKAIETESSRLIVAQGWGMRGGRGTERGVRVAANECGISFCSVGMFWN